jgi:hypothetical protein
MNTGVLGRHFSQDLGFSFSILIPQTIHVPSSIISQRRDGPIRDRSTKGLRNNTHENKKISSLFHSLQDPALFSSIDSSTFLSKVFYGKFCLIILAGLKFYNEGYRKLDFPWLPAIQLFFDEHKVPNRRKQNSSCSLLHITSQL